MAENFAYESASWCKNPDSRLIVDPELLFLDEPTTGFDPSARRRAWELVANLRIWEDGAATTHYLDGAEHLADRVGIVAAEPAHRLRHLGSTSGAGGSGHHSDLPPA